MNLIYQTIHFKGSEELEQGVRKKMDRVSAQNPEIMQAHVTFSEGASGNVENQFCEIKLEVPGNDIVVKKNAETYEQSFRMALEAARKIMRRRKQ